MEGRPRTRRHRLVFLTLALLCATLLGFGAASGAAASPPGKWLTVAELQTALDAAPGGELSGHFDTVLRGATVSEIPATVKSLVPDALPIGSLIFFQATGPRIDDIGGIAQGMSGSPLYVDVGGREYLVGAVSYGDMMVKGNLGLATPVEYMSDVESRYLPGLVRASLPKPVDVAGGQVTSVVVASTQRAARRVPTHAGTVVMRPLATIAIGGLPERSAAYRDLATRLQQRGYDVAPSGTLSAGRTPLFETPLAGGSSVGVQIATGDVPIGALGTVTYVDGDQVLIFGHSLDGMGDVQYYMTNAWVDGMWSSNFVPYKLMSAGAVRGTILQDRIAAVAGLTGAGPADFPLTSSYVYRRGAQSISGAVNDRMPRSVLSWGTFIASDLLSYGGYRATDAWAFPGSAETVATIRVSDGLHPATTIVRRNVWSDTYDVLWPSSWDIGSMLDELTTDVDGVNPAVIESVHLDAAVSSDRKTARVAEARIVGRLRAGTTNKVEVSLFAYGQEAPLTVSVELPLPAGTPTTGTLTIRAAVEDDRPEELVGSGAGASRKNLTAERATLADRIAAIEAMPTNDQLLVRYTPDQSGETLVDPIAVTTTVPHHAITGSLELRTGRVKLHVAPAVVTYLGSLSISGTVSDTSKDTEVALYAEPVGASERTPIGKVTAFADGQGGASFATTVSGFAQNTRIWAEWDGGASSTSASASKMVSVRQRVSLSPLRATVPPSGTVKLVATVAPGRSGQTVRFETLRGGNWILLKRATLGSDGTSAFRWSPPAGTHKVRVYVPATSANAAGTSAVAKVVSS